MPNLSALAPITTAATALANLILVSPQDTIGYQPQNPPLPNGGISLSPQPDALLFHYEGEQTAALESDITDHYVEDNTAVQDQIALHPEVVTTHGYIGELNDVVPDLLAPLKFIEDKLTVIGAYTPQVTATAQLAYSEALLLYEVATKVADSAVSAWDFFTGQGGESTIDETGLSKEVNQNKQQTAFQQFYGYWRSRTLFTVQTPWAVFKNMAIWRLRAIQSEETDVITDFEVSFKMIRTAQTSDTGSGLFSFGGQLGSQAAPLTNLGTSTPASSIGLGAGLAGMGVA